MTDIEQQERIDVFVGVDLGKGAHNAVALDLTGKRLLDSALPNDEAKSRALTAKLKEHGRVLLVVDRFATTGALPVAVTRAEGVAVAYLPGLAMRRIVDLHAGGKDGARDACIIASWGSQSRHPRYERPGSVFLVQPLLAITGCRPGPVTTPARIMDDWGLESCRAKLAESQHN